MSRHRSLTPVQVEALVAAYYIPEFPADRLKSLAHGDAVVWARERGLMHPTEWKLTPKGNAWVLAILNTPEPVQHWLDPRTRQPIPGANPTES